MKKEEMMINSRLYGLGIFWALIVLSCATVQAEQAITPPQEPKTKMESFQRQTGAVVIKGYSEIGVINGMGSVSVDCMEFKDATTGKRQMGIVIEVKESGRFENSERSFIDYDEASALLNGIDYISKVKADATRLRNF